MTDGHEIFNEANKKLKSAGTFLSGIFGGSGSKLDDAASLFTKAGNRFKMDKHWADAGKSFEKAAETHLRADSKHDAVQSYVEASSAYKKVDTKRAIEILDKVIAMLLDMGRFSMVARHYQAIAEMYENELSDALNAIRYYEKAADTFRDEDASSASNKCLLKAAELLAISEKYQRAIEIYESVATSSSQNPMLRYGIKDYLFKACLCQLCVDVVNGQMAADRVANDISKDFADTREYKLIKKIAEAVEQGSLEQFNKAIKDHEMVSRLDKWCSQLVLRVRKPLEDEGTDDLL